MKPGIYNMSDEDYFADEAINNSGLKEVLRSPAHYKWKKDHPKEQTASMLGGKALHCAILEPDAFNERYAVLPEDAPAAPTKAMINAKNPSDSSVERVLFWEAFNIASEGKDILKADVAADCLHVAKMVRGHPELAAYFERGKAEHAIFAQDPVTGVMCKCKPDYLTKVGEYRVKIELKSADDARERFFTRSVMNYGYFQGAAFYTDIMDWSPLGPPDLYLMVVMEREAPYGIKIYEVTPSAIAYGRRQYRKALDLYAYCVTNGEWPNYDTEITPLNLPAWVKE